MQLSDNFEKDLNSLLVMARTLEATKNALDASDADGDCLASFRSRQTEVMLVLVENIKTLKALFIARYQPTLYS